MGSFFILLSYFTFQLFLLLLLLTNFTSYTFSLCNHHDSSALLQLKNTFFVNTSSTPDDIDFGCSAFFFKTETWNNSTDCCDWDGVTCDNVSDYVIGLDLSCNNLKGELHPNSTIFQLRHLQQLNLAYNDFSGSSVHVGIGDLVNLTHLNLSYCYLSGNIPSTISHFSKLVSLDLSSNLDTFELNPFTWKKLIHNATNLRELYLEGVDMSSIRESSLSMLKNLSSDILSLPNLQKLDLSSNYYLSGQLPKSNWSTPLRYLDLSYITFSGEVPYSIDQLKSLTHLALQGCNLDGTIPLSLLNHTQLIYLDLSHNRLNGEIPNVYGNLIKLEFLALSHNKLTGELPSSLFQLPQLSMLDLSFNKLVGPIPIAITKHSKLSYLGLNDNMLNGTIPHWCYYLSSLLMLDLSNNHLTDFIGEFSTYSLQYLGLSNNNLHGHFPNSIFEFQNLTGLYLSSTNVSGVVDFHQFSKFNRLTFLNLSNNSFLSTNIDSKVISISSPYLEQLDLSFSNISSFPKFLAPNLQTLDLSNNNIHGKIPTWFHNLLHSLEYIDLSFNKLQGNLPIPPHYIYTFLLSNNNFTGDISSTFCNVSALGVLNLAHNKLTGMIPQCLGTLPSLFVLDLQMNNLYGSMPRNFSNENQLETIKFNGNQLEGPLPDSLAHCKKVEVLDLGDNMIEDVFPNWLGTLPELQVLSLRSNKFYGTITCSSTKHLFLKLKIFDVSNNNFSGPLPTSCIKKFQGMMNVNDSQTGFRYMYQSGHFYNDSVEVITKGFYMELTKILITFTTIDLSNNMFQGEIPQVIGEINSLKGLNLSNNGITGNIPQSLSYLRNLEWLDLSRNHLTGDLPIPPYGIYYFLVSNNNFSGEISSAFCNAMSMEVLNLAHNKLTGMIPHCLGTLPFLSVLDLQRNSLHGSMPRNFSKGNQFETIKLNDNQLEGPLPHSLGHCKNLEVLDLGDNNIEDVFPNWLETLTELHVLSLRSNKFHGTIKCSSTKHPLHKLRIFYVSNNNFSGPLPTSCIKNFQGMMNVNDSQIGLQYMDKGVGYYKDSVVVIMKGFSIELTRILITFTTIDLSNNMFEGEIPQLIGDLKFLKGLNLSNNGITGTIPQSLSKLRNLEWLDLSRNQLRGEIPMALSNLNFLSVLNLSQNHLEGMIPTGQQFDTFGNESFEGNTMLCGFQLSKSCKNDEDQPSHSTSKDEEESGFGWKAVAIGYACGAILGLLLGYIVFFVGKPQWIVRHFEHMFNIRLKRRNNRSGAERRRMN